VSVAAKPHTGTCNCHAGTRRASSPPRNRHTPAFARRCRSRQSTLLIPRSTRAAGSGGGRAMFSANWDVRLPISCGGPSSARHSLSHHLAYWWGRRRLCGSQFTQVGFRPRSLPNCGGCRRSYRCANPPARNPRLGGPRHPPNRRSGNSSLREWRSFNGRGRRCHTLASALTTNALTKSPKAINHPADNGRRSPAGLVFEVDVSELLSVSVAARRQFGVTSAVQGGGKRRVVNEGPG